MKSEIEDDIVSLFFIIFPSSLARKIAFIHKFPTRNRTRQSSGIRKSGDLGYPRFGCDRRRR